MCEPVDKRVNFRSSQRQVGSEKYRYPHVPSFLEYVHNRQIRLKKEQEEKEQKIKEKAEAHLYTIIKVARDEDLVEQIGKDIYFDLVDHDKVRRFRIQKQTPFNVFKEEVAKVFGIPVQYQRFWLWGKRQNHTYRPNHPLSPQEEAQLVGQLREVSNEANNAELKLFLEVELGQDLRSIPPPDKTKEDILLFFKLYDPLKEELRFVGRIFVKGTGRPLEVLAKINGLAGFAPEEDIELYEEIKFEPIVMCEPVHKGITFRSSQLEDGDIICFQKSSEVGSEKYRYPDVPSFLDYVHNRQAVYHMPTTENHIASGSIPLALQSPFYKLQYRDTSVATKELTKSFGWDSYDSFMQHDVQELDRVLCEKLEDKMKGTVVEGTTQQLFEGHRMNYIECINVDYKSTRKESFYDLQLDVKRCKDVYASLDKYVEVECLEGDNKYHAENHGLQDARKGVLFIDFPPILQLQLKRFEYDFMRDTMVKINDRYEFPLQLDLDREYGKYLSPDADISVRNLYTLHRVLVHSGGVHGGHYYTYIRPTLSDQWFKFDDERVTKEDIKRALEEQYGGEEELRHTNPGFNNSPFKLTKYSNAYMLVYIRESDKDKIICNVDEKDIAEHFRIRLKKEQEEKEQKRKEKAEAHLYTSMKVARDEDLVEQIGKDIYFDLVDHDKVRSFRIHKQTHFNVFKEEVAKVFGIPVQYQRFWLWAKRQNHTYRPHRPLSPEEESQPVEQLWEVPNKANNVELKLFLEVERGQDLRSIRPPDKTKEYILLFFKLYDPLKEELRFVGRIFVKGTGRPLEVLAKINGLAGFAPEEDIELYEEIKFEPNVMCEPVDKRLTFRSSQLEDGDIICFQKSSEVGSEKYCYPDVPSFLEYVHNRQIILEQKRMEKAEAHLYTIMKVARDEDLVEQIGKDIYFDLVDHDKVRSFRIHKQTPFYVFKEEVAKVFGIPVQYQRFWLWAKRQNHTYRPNRALSPQEESQPVEQLWEVPNKANNAELKLFLEVERGQDLRSIPPPDKTKEDILLFFKLYDPLKEELRFVGRIFVKGTGRPLEVLAKINGLAGFAPEEDIELYEEVKFEPSIMCEPVDKRLTFRSSQLEDGDIICFQKSSEVGSEKYRYPDVPSFLDYVHNRQQPNPQPIKYRGCLKTLKVAFHHATQDEVVIHTIRLPKQSTVGDALNELKTKVELSQPDAELRLVEVFYHKIYKIFPLHEKIENINDQYWTLRAEEIPEEEKNLGPHDRLIHVYHFTKETTQNRMIQNFGEPFFLVIHEGEPLAEVKVRIQKKLQIPDEEFAKWKFAFLSPGRHEYLQDSEVVSARFQRRDVYGAWEQYLGLEHSDNTPKRSYVANQNRHTYEKPVKIYN